MVMSTTGAAFTFEMVATGLAVDAKLLVQLMTRVSTLAVDVFSQPQEMIVWGTKEEVWEEKMFITHNS